MSTTTESILMAAAGVLIIGLFLLMSIPDKWLLRMLERRQPAEEPGAQIIPWPSAAERRRRGR